ADFTVSNPSTCCGGSTTYARHGASEPMFGVSFATLKTLYKRIKVDQELAQARWSAGNFDALNLAVKIADPAGISSRELDRWAVTPTARICGGYVAHLAAESPHARAKADKWLAASDDATASIEKAWKHSKSKGFETPAAHERSRESVRMRC
ncbi:MAG: hypothetical protein ACREJO_10370, partial [Phycisphaerales bacterium]